MPIPFVAGNWKMHTTVEEAVALATALREPLEHLGGVTRVVCPPFVSLAAVSDVLQGSGIAVGAQNMHPDPEGAFTGEVSPTMLRGLCQYVIVGHSERRQRFGEEDDFINQKVLSALKAGLVPILCVGEQLAQREAGQAKKVVTRQLQAALSDVDAEALAGVVIAYEPVWAIGTGHAATGAIAQEMMGLLRRLVSDLSGPQVASRVPLLYGGSVTAENVGQYVQQPDIDGALVGGASLRAEEFAVIARQIAVASAKRIL